MNPPSELSDGGKVENHRCDTSAVTEEFSHDQKPIRCVMVYEIKKDKDDLDLEKNEIDMAKGDNALSDIKTMVEKLSIKDGVKVSGETMGSRGPNGKPAGISSEDQPPTKFTKPHNSCNSFSIAATYSATDHAWPDYCPSYDVQLNPKVAQNSRPDISSVPPKFISGPPRNHFEKSPPQLAFKPGQCFLTNGNVLHDRYGQIISQSRNQPGLQCIPGIRKVLRKPAPDQPSQHLQFQQRGCPSQPWLQTQQCVPELRKQPHQFHDLPPLSSSHALMMPSVQNQLQNFTLPQQQSQLPNEHQQQIQLDQQCYNIFNSPINAQNLSFNFSPQYPFLPAGSNQKQNHISSSQGQTPYCMPPRQLPLPQQLLSQSLTNKTHREIVLNNNVKNQMQTANNSVPLNCCDFIQSFDSFSKNLNTSQECNKVSKTSFNNLSQNNNFSMKMNNQSDGSGSGSGYLTPIKKINNLNQSAALYSSGNFAAEIASDDLQDLLKIFSNQIDATSQLTEEDLIGQLQRLAPMPEITSLSCQPLQETNSLPNAPAGQSPTFLPIAAGNTFNQLNDQNDSELNYDKAEFEKVLKEYENSDSDFFDFSIGDEFQFEKQVLDHGDLMKKNNLSNSYSSITDSYVSPREYDFSSISPFPTFVDDENSFGSIGSLDKVQFNPDLIFSFNELEDKGLNPHMETTGVQPVPVSNDNGNIRDIACLVAASDKLNPSESCQLQTSPRNCNSSLEEVRENAINQKIEVLNFLAQDEEGDNALHRAVIDGDLEAVNSILASLLPGELKKKVVEMKNIMAQTPLCMAVVENQPSIVRSLVRAGADISVTINSKQGRTRNDGAKNTLTFTRPLHFSAARGQEWIDCLRELLASEDYDVNSLDSKGKTPLHCAIEVHKTSGRHGTIDSLATVQLLIQNGADLNVPDGCFDMTALHYAIKSKSIAMVSCLLNFASTRCLESGGSVSPSKSPNLGGEKSPNHTRKSTSRVPGQAEGGTALTRMLSAKTGTGYNALHLAVSLDMKPEIDHLRLIQLLLKGGVDPSAKNSEGQLPRELTKNENVIKILRGIGLGTAKQTPQIMNQYGQLSRTPASLNSPSMVSCYSVSPR